jgi:hypothetical protein
LKVLLVTGSFPPQACGVGDYSYNLSRTLVDKLEIELSVLTSVFSEENESEINSVNLKGIKLFRVIKNWGGGDLVKYIQTLFKVRPDLVHIQYPTQGYKDKLLPYLLPVITYLCGFKVVQTWHEIYSFQPNFRLILQSIVPGGVVVVRGEYLNKLHPKIKKFLANKIFYFIKNASAIPAAIIDEKEKLDLKQKYLKGQKRLLIFFGFIYRHKGLENVFEIANPDTDHILIIGKFGDDIDYNNKITRLTNTSIWVDKVTIAGFLPPEIVAKLLAISDAVLLPFITGGGEWNTSIHSAVLQKAFVLTTSETSIGYDPKRNIYYAFPNDIQEMKVALDKYAGKYRESDSDVDKDEWYEIAKKHETLYNRVLVS